MNSDIVILIPHFNNPSGLENSLRSITSPHPLDVLVVDDGSVMKPDEFKLLRLFKDKLKIHFIYNSVNEGIERTLNNGLRYIQEHLMNKYIARLDCGDTCAPDRFIRQKEWLDVHPDIYLIGSWVEFVDEKSKKIYIYKAPSEHHDIVKNMYVKCSFIHPSVMFRTEALNEIGLYPLNYKAAEDYAFFFKFVKKYKTYIIPKVLTYCELNPKGISRMKRHEQQKSKIKVLIENWSPTPYFLLGIIRNYIILLLPYSLVTKAKAILLK